MVNRKTVNNSSELEKLENLNILSYREEQDGENKEVYHRGKTKTGQMKQCIWTVWIIYECGS